MTKTRTVRNGKKPATTGKHAGGRREVSGAIARATSRSPRGSSRNVVVVPVTHATTWAEMKMLLGPTSVPASAIRRAVAKAVSRNQAALARHKIEGKSQVATRPQKAIRAR